MNVTNQTLARLDGRLERDSDNVESTGPVSTDRHLRPVANAKKPVALFVINSLEGGGAERVFTILLDHIQPYFPNVEIEVVLLDDRPQRYQITAPMRVTCLKSSGGFLDSAKKFRAYLQQHRPDLVVSFLTRANYLNAAFARQFGYRAILSERSDTSGRLGSGVAGWAKKRLVRTLYPRADKIIAVSAGIKKGLVADYGASPQSVEVIYNPYDLAALTQLAQASNPIAEKEYILAVGRLVPTKRFDVLIRAFAQGQFQEKLVILGEGPKLGELRALAESLGVGSRVLFPGFLPNPYAVMARASVYVLSSELEGFPNALVEAMSLGCPVIATNCNHGPAEILDETVMPDITGVHIAQHGVLVPTGDAQAMAHALRHVLTDSGLRKRLSQVASRRASHFTVAATIELYRRVLHDELAYVP